MSDTTWAAMTQDAATSLQRQKEIEAQQSPSFETYLAQFYQQYKKVGQDDAA
jgi:hypothetical protein